MGVQPIIIQKSVNELKQIFHTSRTDSIKRSMQSAGMNYQIEGRGGGAVYAFTEPQSVLKLLLISDYGFTPNRNLDKACELFKGYFLGRRPYTRTSRLRKHQMMKQRSSYNWNCNIPYPSMKRKSKIFPAHEKRQGCIALAFYLFVHHFSKSMCRHAGSTLYLYIAGNRGCATPGQSRNRRKTSVLLIEFMELLDFLWCYSFGLLIL